MIDSIVFSESGSYFWCRAWLNGKIREPDDERYGVWSVSGDSIIMGLQRGWIVSFNFDSNDNFYYSSGMRDSLTIYSLEKKEIAGSVTFEGTFIGWWTDGSKFATRMGTSMSAIYSKNGDRIKYVDAIIGGGTGDYYWVGNAVHTIATDSTIGMFAGWPFHGNTFIDRSDSQCILTIISADTLVTATTVFGCKGVNAIDTNLNWAVGTSSGMLYDNSSDSLPETEKSYTTGVISCYSRSEHDYLLASSQTGKTFVYRFTDSGPEIIDTIRRPKDAWTETVSFDKTIIATGTDPSSEIIGMVGDTMIYFYKLSSDTLYSTHHKSKVGCYFSAEIDISLSGNIVTQHGCGGVLMWRVDSDTEFFVPDPGYPILAPSNDDLWIRSEDKVCKIYRKDSLLTIADGYGQGWVTDSTFILFDKYYTITSAGSAGDYVSNACLYKIDGTKTACDGLNKVFKGKRIQNGLFGNTIVLSDSLLLLLGLYIGDQRQSIFCNFYTGDTLKIINKKITPIGRQWGWYTEGNKINYLNWRTAPDAIREKNRSKINTRPVIKKIRLRNNAIVVNFSNKISGPVGVSIFDCLGRLCYSGSGDLRSSERLILSGAHGIKASNSYILRVTFDDNVYCKRILVLDR